MNFEIPIPPLAEQRRIVAKIEELFSELDKGIETLKTAKAQLAVYRQAILKDAFEGKLTAGWRADHRDLIESSEQLLARVCAEREARYEKQLSDWKTAVQKWESGNQKDSRPCKPRNPSIVALPLKEEVAHLPALAEGWTWLRLRSCNVDVSDGPFGSNLKTSDYVGAGVRVVRLENIGVMKFIEEKESFITEEKYRLLSDHTVSPGDIVFSSFITERTRVAMVPPSIEKAVNKADCFSLRSHGSVLLNRYLCVFLSSRLVYTELESAIHGVGRPRINTTQLKELFVPVCSPSEQIAVMQEIDLQQSVLDEMESEIETNLQKAEALRQSILKRAFAGELVPQDPSDEPASLLLERIRAERDAKPNQVSKKSSPKNPNAKGRKPRAATI
jgi:type I restriction enzyme S subunit